MGLSYQLDDVELMLCKAEALVYLCQFDKSYEILESIDLPQVSDDVDDDDLTEE